VEENDFTETNTLNRLLTDPKALILHTAACGSPVTDSKSTDVLPPSTMSQLNGRMEAPSSTVAR